MAQLFATAFAIASIYAGTLLASEATLEMEFRNFATAGDTESVRRLLSNGIDVDAHNQFGKTALMMAVESNQMEMVNLLLTTGASINKRTLAGCTALTFAAENGHIAIINSLLERGADIYSTHTRRLECADDCRSLWLFAGR